MSRGSKGPLAGVLLLVFSCAVAVGAQTAEQSSGSSDKQPASQAPPFTVSSNLVLVPVLVKTKAGEPVFSLTADDFILTDNGVPQSLRLEPDTDSQPLALAVIVETGGQGAVHLGDYQNLGAVLDAVIGDVPHRVAVIGFDSKPRLVQDFTPDTDSQPLALVVIVDTGGQGAFHLGDYQNLGAVLDAVIGDVPHRVAVIGFDSKPRL